jgi:ATP-dependent protease HslVU (ClpYQ) peptidase subunit
MSTITVVRKNGVAAIAADTMTTFSDTKETAPYIQGHSKIQSFGENYIATVGHASWGLVLRGYFRQVGGTPKLDSPYAIFEMSRELHNVLKEGFFLNPGADDDSAFESSGLSCLIANPYGIFGLYSRRSVQEYTKFYAFGSGSELALGAMWAVYDRLDSAEEIARLGAAAGAEFDSGSGYPVEVFTVPLRESER